ncbi:PREDICTED: ribonucleoside-diphosphate reductase large subunit-like isoform X2 [Camelina sativa]|uniref:Ribonucleoside-diphosphate reductase n=1 Tax=Camelina sativa TaxID=90675 RepID=A0ABM0ZP42_CAMSA|nr:PREDICTED: ribonucleoside-diphosphate reductase large subunit-like isoform X2 [Camelina sativa]
MYVVKRDGWVETFDLEKIKVRLKKLCSYHCNPLLVAQKVSARFYNGITTTQLDELAADAAASMSCNHPHYAYLAARIAVSNLHKNTKNSFSETVAEIYHRVDETSGLKASLIDEHVSRIVMENAARLDSEIIYDRDFDYDYFGFKTLERLYLLKVNGKVVERPQHMLMRVAVGIHMEDIDSAIKSYHLLSQRLFTHASPTLIHAGTPKPQLSSSFLICMKDDSIEATLQKCAAVSKSTGSISVSVHNIRVTNGIVPILDDVAQGGGPFVVYMEPWHADIFEFIKLQKNHGKVEEHMARALWIPDLFMERVKSDGKWSLFCPNEAPGLADCWGLDFERLYTKYEREGKAKKVFEALDLYFDILTSQDSCNRKSNQQNLGTINSSSLCTGVIEYTSPTETAVCNIASIALPRFVREKDIPLESHPSMLAGSLRSRSRYFDFDKLAEVTATVTNDLDRIIDRTNYPVETAKTSNMRHRPICIGVQGLADAFVLLGMPFDSLQAKQLNMDIFETIYYHALNASSDLAARYNAYETYKGSPMSKGILQPDMWNVTPSNRWDWDFLRDMISKNGVRNSLLVSLMPTASTSQILGNNESFEPYASNIYSRRGLSGEFILVNKHLLHDLTEMGLWTPTLKEKVIIENGSICNVPEIPDDLKAIYRTAWEIKQKTVVDMATDRGCYIDQSQSLNIRLEEPTHRKLSSLHFYVWRKGLKTGMHCLMTDPAIKKVNPAMAAINSSTTAPIYSSSSSWKNKHLPTPRTLAVVSYFATIISFYCSSYYISLTSTKKLIPLAFFSVCFVPLFPLPRLNLENRFNGIHRWALCKSVGSFACYYFFNWLGSSIKMESDMFLMNTSLFFLFYLIAMDHIYDTNEHVGLCDGILFAGFGLMTEENTIPQFVVICVGSVLCFLKNFRQLWKCHGGSQLEDGDGDDDSLTADNMGKARTVAVISYFATVCLFLRSTFFASLPIKKLWVPVITFVVCTLLLFPLPRLRLQRRLNNTHSYAICKSIGSFGCNYAFNSLGSSVTLDQDSFLSQASLTFAILLIAFDYLYEVDEDFQVCDGYLFAGFGLMMGQQKIPQWVVAVIGIGLCFIKNYLQLWRKADALKYPISKRCDIENKGSERDHDE